MALLPKLEQTLAAIVAKPTFRAEELPQPTPEERHPPAEEKDVTQQDFGSAILP